MGSRLKFGWLLGSAMMFAASAASAQTVGNGGFEAPPPPAGSFNLYNPGQTIGAFTVFGAAGSNVAVISNTFNDPAGRNNSHTGDAHLDLTGSVDNGGGQQGVVQSVATIQGQAYTLSFYIGHRYDDGAPTIIGVSTTGAMGAYTDFTNSDRSGTSAASISYRLFSLTFVAAGSTTQIAFRDNQPLGQAVAALDDVTIAPFVAAVPGPLAGAGLIPLLGFAGAWFARRCRERLAA